MENFALKFEYKGKPHILEVRPWVQHYKVVYKVMIEGQDVTFEPDEEGQQLRAVANGHAQLRNIDAGLLADVSQRIEDHLAGRTNE